MQAALCLYNFNNIINGVKITMGLGDTSTGYLLGLMIISQAREPKSFIKDANFRAFLVSTNLRIVKITVLIFANNGDRTKTMAMLLMCRWNQANTLQSRAVVRTKRPRDIKTQHDL